MQDNQKMDSPFHNLLPALSGYSPLENRTEIRFINVLVFGKVL